MTRLPFLLALTLPFSTHSTAPSPTAVEIVGPSVLMNAARVEPVAIFDLRPEGRSVPGTLRDPNSPVPHNTTVFVLASAQSAKQWATRRGLAQVSVVPPSMIEFEEMQGVPQLTPQETRTRIEKGWPLFDISEEFEFTAERLPQSSRFDFQDFRARHWTQLPKNASFIVACRVGHRSQLVVKELRAAGYDAHNLCGGLWEWQCQKLPLEGKGA